MDEAVGNLPPVAEDPTGGEQLDIPAEIRESAAAGDDLLDRVIICARAAANADPAKMPVSDDYLDALHHLDTVLAARPLIVYQVRDAARRYAAAFTLPENANDLVATGAGDNEMALMGSVILLREAIQDQDAAHAQLKQRYPESSQAATLPPRLHRRCRIRFSTWSSSATRTNQPPPAPAPPAQTPPYATTCAPCPQKSSRAPPPR
ncbi:hypothetical protein GCM10010176_064770 [Nonomuraea spiralis]|nr:hypothetical protein GCM10010176_064770 [Nonomuraea spiralis]